jgi:molybdate/tungstate transport system substrate-binding protein
VRTTLLWLGGAWLCGACGSGQTETREPVSVFAAASLARPLATLSSGFQRDERTVIRAELGGSLEQVRKLTDLARTPDVLMLVDDEVMAALMPAHLDWYVRFATTRIVVAYTDRSRHSDSITSENWWRTLSRDDVTIGRADSAIAPAGSRALAVLRRAGAYYQQGNLSEQLMGRAMLRFVRPNATELAALLEAGEVDYILEYESVARQYGFRYVALPNDLAVATLYGISVPRASTNAAAAAKFVAFVLSDEGKQIIRDANVDVLRVPVAMGTNLPAEVSDRVRTLAADVLAR